MLLSASIIDKNREDGFFHFALNCLGFLLLHNTFYGNGTNVNGSADGRKKNLWILDHGQTLVANNVFAGAVSPMSMLHAEPALNNAFLDYNCSSRLTNMVRYGAAQVDYSTLSSFRTATGFEAHGVDGAHSGGNPTGLNLANPNGTGEAGSALNAGSACVGAGLAGTGVTTHDYFGNPYGSPPSMGAVAATAVNSLPDAVNDAYTVVKRSTNTLNLLSNDTDPNSDTLTTTSVGPTNHHGKVTINPGGTSVTYKPWKFLIFSFTGTETFTYTVSDGNGGTDTATVTMTVTD